MIESRRDALIWQLVDEISRGRDSREAIAEFELELQRLKANYWLGQEWLIELMRDTDPARIVTGRTACAA